MKEIVSSRRLWSPSPRLGTWSTMALLLLCAQQTLQTSITKTCSSSEKEPERIVLVKVGGSSITEKSTKETLNEPALHWFASVLASEVSPLFLADKVCVPDAHQRNTAFVIVHGAGSFGHHTAKAYGLKGYSEPSPSAESEGDNANEDDTHHRRYMAAGLAETRLSVQKLNQIVVNTFVQHGMNAVAISPCFSVPGMQAHGGNTTVTESLAGVVQATLQAGLLPVLHGDGCLYGRDGVGILSGDVLMEMLGGGTAAPWITEAVFLTDVDGVFTRDPRIDPEAQLVRSIEVDASGEIQRLSGGATRQLQVEASESTHTHDVTGGLKTKLASATSIAATGKNVTIVKCGSTSAEQVFRQSTKEIEHATIIFRTLQDLSGAFLAEKRKDERVTFVNV